MNQLVLSAKVVETDSLRYTPAGIAVLDLVLEHSSEVIEAGQKRIVEMQVRARTMGKVAHEMAKLALGSTIEAKGFITQGRKNTFQICFHIQAWRPR